MRMDRLSLFLDVARENNFPLERVDFKRSFHWGVKGVPELILSAKEFDFNRQGNEDQYYVGPAVEMDRREILYDENYLNTLLQREISEINNEPSRPIIYCSLGTLNTDWYKSCNKFFEKVIEALGDMKEYELYLSVGPDINIEKFSNLPENVQLFNLVPQLDILEKASLMITHGGINSINECIYSGVPMIVYPLSSNIDQKGNAARVVHHQLGIRGNIKNETVKGLKEKVSHILKTPEYKQSVEEMKRIYSGYHERSVFIPIVEFCLSKSHTIYEAETI